MPDQSIPCQLWRGGTSQAVLFSAADLAGFDDAQVNAIILAALGSPDPGGRQIDGLGGGISSRSKAAIIGQAPPGIDADISFHFAQVDVLRPLVDFTGNCGNISAAIGPYAISMGLVPAVEPITSVGCVSANTGQRFVVEVPVKCGNFDPVGDVAIAGVPGTAADIRLIFVNPSGSTGSGTFPTGMMVEDLVLPSARKVRVSIVDAAIPTVFVVAADVGIPGTALPVEIEADGVWIADLESIRSQAAVRLGLAQTAEDAAITSSTIPKVAIVDRPVTYTTTEGDKVGAHETDLLIRLVSMGRVHRTVAVTVAICVASTAQIPGTVVNSVTRSSVDGVVRIGHPAGTMTVTASAVQSESGAWEVSEAVVSRTARLIMDGQVLVPVTCFSGR